MRAVTNMIRLILWWHLRNTKLAIKVKAQNNVQFVLLLDYIWCFLSCFRATKKKEKRWGVGGRRGLIRGCCNVLDISKVCLANRETCPKTKQNKQNKTWNRNAILSVPLIVRNTLRCQSWDNSCPLAVFLVLFLSSPTSKSPRRAKGEPLYFTVFCTSSPANRDRETNYV